MPDTLGEPGKYPDAKVRQISLWVFVLAILALSIMSYVFGVLTPKTQAPTRAAFFLVWAVASLVLLKYLDREVAKAASERRAYLKGGDGEHWVGYLLGDLPASYHVFHGIQLEKGSDIDHVIVGQGGVFLVSTKNWRGLITVGSGGKLLWNGRLPDKGDVIQTTLRATMRLRERLMALVGEDVYVQGVLVLPWAWVDIPGLVRNVSVLHQGNLVSWIEGAPHRLNAAKVRRLTGALRMLAEAALSVRAEQPPSVHRSSRSA